MSYQLGGPGVPMRSVLPTGFLRRELERRGVDPARLILEITETDASSPAVAPTS
jgi:EAL domain-containing protein (putative c-di-GMP-specific phosphodiesterase class I)